MEKGVERGVFVCVWNTKEVNLTQLEPATYLDLQVTIYRVFLKQTIPDLRIRLVSIQIYLILLLIWASVEKIFSRIWSGLMRLYLF